MLFPIDEPNQGSTQSPKILESKEERMAMIHEDLKNQYADGQNKLGEIYHDFVDFLSKDEKKYVDKFLERQLIREEKIIEALGKYLNTDKINNKFQKYFNELETRHGGIIEYLILDPSDVNMEQILDMKKDRICAFKIPQLNYYYLKLQFTLIQNLKYNFPYTIDGVKYPTEESIRRTIKYINFERVIYTDND